MIRNLSSSISELTVLNRSTLVGDFLDQYGALEGFLVLNSGADGNIADSRTYVFLEPVYFFESTGIASTIRSSSGVLATHDKAWGVYFNHLEAALNSTSLPPSIPITGGYLGYEMLHSLETTVPSQESTLPYPLASFALYRKILEIPRNSNQPVNIIRFDWGASPLWEATNLDINISSDSQRCRYQATEISSNLVLNDTSLEDRLLNIGATSDFTKSDYLSTIETIRSAIRKGEVYQVNLTRSVRIPFNRDPRRIYEEMSKKTKAEFGAFYCGKSKSGEPYFILCSSPERFISSDGDNILSSPIKGTRPRGASAGIDTHLIRELQTSEKDLAELAMIVDLIRNDLGKVSEIGSVRVEAHARLETHPYLHHLVSDVKSKLEKGKSTFELIAAMFPSGSITGAPKIASMKIISELERDARGVYTGTIGWLGTKCSMNLNVAIRTGIIYEGFLTAYSGGGIVIDSLPDAEYQETLTKLRPWMECVK